jgi:hypothetical protein
VEPLGYRFVFRCAIDGEPRIAAPDELEELGWFHPQKLPSPMTWTGPHAVRDAAAGRLGVARDVFPA